MKRYFDISTHALVISAFIALALTGRLDFPSIAIYSVAALWSLYRTLRQQPDLLNARATFYLSCTYIVFFGFDNLVLSRSFIPATVHMVLFLELVKLFQKKTDRDYFYLIILAFLMVLAAASLTVDISFIVTLLMFLVALVATLMSFDIVRGQRSHSPTPEPPAVSLTGISVWASAWIVLVGAGLFFLIPRVGTGYFSRASVPPVLLSGFSDNVRLGEIGRIKLSSTVVMRAKRVSGKPSAGLKWRGIALDQFDGHIWHKTDPSRNEVRTSGDGIYLIHALEHSGDGVRYDILLEPMTTTTLFGPYHVRSIASRQDVIATDHDDSVFIRVQQQRRIQYQVLSELPNRTRDVPTVEPDDMARYLQLPQDLDPRVIALARNITQAATTPAEKAARIEAYLRKNYRYTLNLTWAPGPQPLRTFLFDAKTGHCEYFASAMAILARAAGVPTRLVNGFQMGEFNPVGGDYIVRESDAHSWVEAYIPGRGWMEFDATPPDLRPTDTGIAAQLARYMDAMELAWSSYVLVYDNESQWQLFRNAQEHVQGLQAEFRSGSDEWSLRMKTLGDRVSHRLRGTVEASWFWMLVLAAIAGTMAFRNRRNLRTHWHIWKLRRGAGTADMDVVAHLFHRIAKLAVRRSPARQPGQTWREWVMNISNPDRRSIVLPALTVFEQSMYSRTPLSAQDFAVLDSTIRKLQA